MFSLVYSGQEIYANYNLRVGANGVGWSAAQLLGLPRSLPVGPGSILVTVADGAGIATISRQVYRFIVASVCRSMILSW
jgi:hypothetical protein